MIPAGTWLAAIPTPPGGPLATPTPTASNFGAGVITFSFALSVLTWAPVVMALVIALLPSARRGRFDRWPLGFAFWTVLGTLALTLVLYSQFQSFTTGIQFEEKLPWLPAIGVAYHLGIDGIGMTVLITNQLVGVAAVLASWEVRERTRTYFALLLLTEAAVTGAVAARDFFLLFLFWSLATVPVAMLAAGWGGSRRRAAGGRVLGIWGLGSAALLAGGLLIYTAAGSADFDLATLAQAQPSARVQLIAGILVVIAAGTRLPLVPLHGWARELLADAPAGVAVLVAGAAARLGGYVLVRLLAGLLHDGSKALAPAIGAAAAVTVVYAAVAALRSHDLRRIAAYLALIPGGITVLGVAGLSPLSLHGVVLSLFAGGLAAALVVGAGATLAERVQARDLSVAAGLAGRVPVLSWLLLLGSLAVLGVPFAATFTSGVMVFLGSFARTPGPALAVAAGLAAAAVAIGWLGQRALFGAPSPDAPAPQEATLADKWYLGILVGGLLWVGLVPGGPKLFGIPLFDPGMVNVVTSATSDLASTYAPTPVPTPASSPSSSPSPSPAAAPPTPGPTP